VLPFAREGEVVDRFDPFIAALFADGSLKLAAVGSGQSAVDAEAPEAQPNS
jgi:hypothetical protein